MRIVIIVIALALLAAAAGATDLNPEGGNACGAGAIVVNPSGIQGDENFNKLYDNLDAKLGDGEMYMINTDDTTWWLSGDLRDPDRNYTYMMIKFVKPQGYDTGTLNWCVRVGGGADVYGYRWDKVAQPHQWDFMNKNDGGSQPATETYEIPASYFDINGVLWLLFKGNGYPEDIDADVVDIHW